jgi:surfeit locus 1 family protein
MIRRLPIIPTIIVAAAVVTMIALGFWQLRRAEWKEALLARYEAAQTMPPIAFPTTPIGKALPLFRRASGLCLQPITARATAGRNRKGDRGYSHIVDCRTGAEGPGMSVDIGWSADPNAGKGWTGGPVSGVIAPDKKTRMRLVSDRGFAGLEPSAPPSTDSIPNNHRAYAVQWFLFALIALVIYGLALRGRLAKKAD